MVMAMALAFSLAFLINFSTSHAPVYADSLMRSGLKHEIKQHTGQDSLCLRLNDCKQANEGQQVERRDNAASGLNDQQKH
jgi:hypothetical protein